MIGAAGRADEREKREEMVDAANPWVVRSRARRKGITGSGWIDDLRDAIF